ncbi:OmpA family protein [Kaarinaea lacus]
MDKRKEWALEAFLFITFPIALFAGCTGSSDFDQKAVDVDFFYEPVFKRSAVSPDSEVANSAAESDGEQAAVVDYDAYDRLLFLPEAPQRQTSISEARWVNAVYKTAGEIGVSPDNRSNEHNASLLVVAAPVVPDQHVLHFDQNEIDIKAEHHKILKQHAKMLERNRNLILTVSGHADSHSSAAEAKIISQQRAELVARQLISYGAPQEQIIVDSYGDSLPLNDAHQWQENRRVELEYSSARVMRAGI